MEKQCQLVVDWMRVGFIHGVMNTDNMQSLVKQLIMVLVHLWIIIIPKQFLAQ